MERRSDKHTPRVDEEMRRETESLVRGSPVEARAEESRQQEAPAEGEPAPDAFPSSGEVERRAEVARHLSRTSFPGDRDELLSAARSQGAPDRVVELLESLPAGRYDTVADVWSALGGSVEHR